MPLARYGVLKGRITQQLAGQGNSPHHQLRIIDQVADYRAAVNVRSALAPSELMFAVIDDFQHPLTEALQRLPPGFTELESRPGGMALDYIRGNLLGARRLKVLPYAEVGPANDLYDQLDALAQRVMGEGAANIYAFGEPWSAEPQKDKYMGFFPGAGIHNIHMNQGNDKSFAGDDGPWQDGGLLLSFPQADRSLRWVAVFLAFQSQALHTDDGTGHTIPAPAVRDGLVRIVAARLRAPRGQAQTVTLLNTGAEPVDLAGWCLADYRKARCPLTGILAPGAAVAVPVAAPLALANTGDIITLLDEAGLKIDGAAYSKRQVPAEGHTLILGA
ncbi:YukJ family protein [Nannocystis sp.]|uniref:YukJ family protein n=1 Tax=Nannocystis sp. TaxID=1962667 RepID=UPI0025DE62AA|nr:YukJ family protein [Nannocystis sp.]MBK7830701.1 DUF2278 family protein [Nannocystis sp.]